ncbi:MAG: TIM barrel protein [Gemmatimonadaceae bacterium]
MSVSRREFLASLAVAAVACARSTPAATATGAVRFRFGYSASTWGNLELVAIDEISKLGFPGIQFRPSVMGHFMRQPSVLRDLMAQKKLQIVAVTSGSVTLDPASETRMIDEHVARARFVGDVGGSFLQVTDLKPSADVTPEQCTRLGQLLAEIGHKCAEFGVTLAYHPHMGTIGERPENLEHVLAESDPRNVKLLLDVGHYLQGGGDPADAIRRHRERLGFVHLTDVETITGGLGYRFVELGNGRVNLPAVFDALRATAFGGWAVVELDAVTTPDRSARESADISKAYLEAQGFTIT